MSFSSIAAVLRPVDPGIPWRVREAGDAWEPPPPDVTLWGRPPAPAGTPPRRALGHAARRERARLRLRGREAAWTAWGPPDLGGSGGRARIRHALLAGAVVELGRPGPRVVDAAAAEAGATGPVGAFRPGSGGALLARLPGWVLLRVAPAGSPGDPTPAAGALRALQDPRIPRLVAAGVTREAAWTAEAVLPGRRPRRISGELWAACAAICAALPEADSPTAVAEDFDALARALPGLPIDSVRDDAVRLTARLGGAARHGDLWRPNLLAEGGTLTGVVDWDAWHPAAAPGTDLLNLFASERHGPGLGAAWSRAPWRSEEFRDATRAYWRARGGPPSADEMEGVALAWWAGQAAASLRRLPHLAGREPWVEANVAAVLRSASA